MNDEMKDKMEKLLALTDDLFPDKVVLLFDREQVASIRSSFTSVSPGDPEIVRLLDEAMMHHDE